MTRIFSHTWEGGAGQHQGTVPTEHALQSSVGARREAEQERERRKEVVKIKRTQGHRERVTQTAQGRSRYQIHIHAHRVEQDREILDGDKARAS